MKTETEDEFLPRQALTRNEQSSFSESIRQPHQVHHSWNVRCTAAASIIMLVVGVIIGSSLPVRTGTSRRSEVSRDQVKGGLQVLTDIYPDDGTADDTVPVDEQEPFSKIELYDVQQANERANKCKRRWNRCMRKAQLKSASEQVRVALVTGGTTGIGLAVAERLARLGFFVVVASRSIWKFENVATPHLQAAGIPLVECTPPSDCNSQTPAKQLTGAITYYKADIRVEADVKELVNFTAGLRGRLDAVVNNAGVAVGSGPISLTPNVLSTVKLSGGISLTVPEAPSQCDKASVGSSPWVFNGTSMPRGNANCCEAAFSTEATAFCENPVFTDEAGLYLAMSYELAAMRKYNGKDAPGSVVNICSLNAVVGAPAASLYPMAKAACLLLTRNAALEQTSSGLLQLQKTPGAATIRVNAILPGPVDTPLMRASAPPGSACSSGNGSLQADMAAAYSRAARQKGEALDRANAAYRKELDAVFGAAVPLGRMADPSELAGPIADLLGSDSSYMTGATVFVDGGMQAGWGTFPSPTLLEGACPKKTESGAYEY